MIHYMVFQIGSVLVFGIVGPPTGARGGGSGHDMHYVKSVWLEGEARQYRSTGAGNSNGLGNKTKAKLRMKLFVVCVITHCGSSVRLLDFCVRIVYGGGGDAHGKWIAEGTY